MKSRNTYNLITLDVQAMRQIAIERSIYERTVSGAEEKYIFFFDLGSNVIKGQIIKSFEGHADNPLLFQIRKCLEAMPGYHAPHSCSEGQDCLKKSIVYVDFGDVFSDKKKGAAQKKKAYAADSDKLTQASKEKIFEDMFSQGITIKFEDGDSKTFMPFDRSASMSRQSMMTFVDKDLLPAAPDEHNAAPDEHNAASDEHNIEKRLCLDIDFSKINVQPSKYYAYRGLYLTDGSRVGETQQFPLNEETVLVLKDDVEKGGYIHHSLKDLDVITYDTAVFMNKDTRGKIEEIRELRDKIEIKGFDGEGLVSPEYAAWINESLNLGKKKNRATSFQIRMPFVKGMLHQVDFCGFVKEFTHRSDLKIEDAFGIWRDLSKAHIILTTSMFKCRGWLEEYKEKVPCLDDPMKFYFEKLHKYSHSLYVASTNLNNQVRGTVKLNYQFLNTLDMDEKTFSSLVEDQIKLADDVLNFPDKSGRERILSPEEYEQSDNDGSSFTEDSTDAIKEMKELDFKEHAWKYAVRENPAFVYDPYIKEKLKQEHEAILRAIAYGNIEVTGALEYLSDDLFQLLIYLLCISDLDPGTKEARVNYLRERTLYKDRFYLADAEKIGINRKNRDNYFAILRSPHLSRNEQCALRAYVPNPWSNVNLICRTDDGKKVNVYQKYFSHLKGVLMVGYKSTAALSLGGADYDGDYVKIITDKRVNDAVLKGAYVKKEKSYIRKLPVAFIDSPKESTAKLSKFGSRDHYLKVLELAKNTFSNSIGRISNNAINIGRAEYFGTPEMRSRYEGRCAMSTVIAGLEIDAAKTGIHPLLEEFTSTDGNNRKKKPDYIDVIKVLKTTGPNAPKISRSSHDPDKLEVTKIFMNGAKEERLEFGPHDFDKVYHSNIDTLPYKYFMAELNSQESGKKMRTPKNNIMFAFEADPARRISLNEDRSEELVKIIVTYKKFNQYVNARQYFKRKLSGSDSIARIHNILRQRYDYGLDTIDLGDSRIDIQSAVEASYINMLGILKDESSAWSALKRYKENVNYFALEVGNEVIDVTCEILNADKNDIEPETWRILLERSANGYLILYYLIRAVCDQYAQDRELDVEYAAGKITEEECDKNLYRSMLAVYSTAELLKTSKNIWMPDIITLCRERLNEIFNKNMDTALQYAFSLRKSKDENGSFFWAIFDIVTIANNLYYPEV